MIRMVCITGRNRMAGYKGMREKIVFLILLFTGGVSMPNAALSDWSVPIGVVFEHNFYSQFGLSASVANRTVLGGHPQVTLSATTSRIGVIAGYNLLKKENWTLTAAWHFRPGTYVDPFAGLDFGVTHFDRENEELFKKLQNTALLFNLRVGIGATVWEGRLRPVLDGGIAFVQSSTVFPLFFGAKLCYDVMKGGVK